MWSMPKVIQKIYLLSIVIVLLFVKQAHPSPSNESIKKNLKNEWLVYNQKHDIYVPFIENTGQSTNSFAFFIKKNASDGEHLHCCVQAGTSFFIEEKIIAFYDTKECFKLNIDSLFKVYDKKDLYISVYNESLRLDEFDTYLVSSKKTHQASVRNTESELIPRKIDDVKNFYIIAFLLFASLLGVAYNTNPKSFKEYYALNKIFTLKLRQDDNTKFSLFNRFTLAILFLHSTFIAFVFMVTFQLKHEVLGSLISLKYNGLVIAIFDWVKLSIIVFSFLILKFLLLQAISKLMHFREIERVHFFEFLRLSIFIYSIALFSVLIVMFSSYSPAANHYNWILYLIGGLSLLRVIFLYIKFLRMVTFKNLYLFLYLCTTEIFPLLMGFKIFIWN